MAFHGTLDGVQVCDLLVALEHGHQTGMLRLSAGRDTGLIYLVQGRVIDAVVLHATVCAARGAVAVACMGRWSTAGFSFSHVDEAPTRLTMLPGGAASSA